MIRLIIYCCLLGAGAWMGAEYQKTMDIRACLNAGGGIDPRGFCEGAK